MFLYPFQPNPKLTIGMAGICGNNYFVMLTSINSNVISGVFSCRVGAGRRVEHHLRGGETAGFSHSDEAAEEAVVEVRDADNLGWRERFGGHGGGWCVKAAVIA
jgi:hypothetical protein